MRDSNILSPDYIEMNIQSRHVIKPRIAFLEFIYYCIRLFCIVTKNEIENYDTKWASIIRVGHNSAEWRPWGIHSAYKS